MKKILVFENLFEYLSSVNKPNYVSTSTDDLYKSEINSDEIEQTEDKPEFIERPEVGDNIGKSSKEDKKYTIKIRSEIQEGVVEDLMYSGRSFYPDMYTHDRVWANDLAKNGIVSIIDGIMTLKVSPKDLTVFGPNNDIIRYKSEIDSDKVEKTGGIKSEINSDEIEQTEDKTEFIERSLKQSAYNLILNLFKSNPDKWFTRKELYDQFERKGYDGRPGGTFHNAAIEDALKRLTQKSKIIKQIKFNEKSKRNVTMWKGFMIPLSDNGFLDKLPKDDETLYPSIRF